MRWKWLHDYSASLTCFVLGTGFNVAAYPFYPGYWGDLMMDIGVGWWLLAGWLRVKANTVEKDSHAEDEEPEDAAEEGKQQEHACEKYEGNDPHGV